MSRTIYVVTSGSYSDYSIYGLFSRKGDARRFADNGRFEFGSRGGANVEEWPVDDLVGAVMRTNYRYSTKDAKGWTFEVNAHPKARTPKPSASISKDQSGNWGAVGDSFVSAEHAKKIATEALQAKLREVVTPTPQNADGDK